MSGDYISREAAIVRATKGLADDFDAYNVKVSLQAIPAADVVERPRWISVKERLPRYGDWVLGIGPKKGYYVCEYRGLVHPPSGDEPWFSANGRTLTITHWMPLPEPPEGMP